MKILIAIILIAAYAIHVGRNCLKAINDAVI